MNIKQLIKDYFVFNRNERKGIAILLILIFFFAIANRLVFYLETPAQITTVLLDSVSQQLGALNDSINRGEHNMHLFAFDPNTIDSTTLSNLEISEQVKLNLLRYRHKGGEFYTKSDFRKIYGVTDDIFLRIEPYLLLDNDRKLESISASKNELFLFDPNTASDDDFIRLGLSGKLIATIRKYQRNGGVYRKKSDFLEMRCLPESQKKILTDYVSFIPVENVPSRIIELNSADSVLLEQLPGIGDKLSKRIVKYRDLLGGFSSLVQLKEVYGLNEQVIFQIQDKVSVDTTKIRRLDLNFADFNELSRHPYLKKNLSKRIIGYRVKYGKIPTLKILCDSMILDIEEYNRLKPYCKE